MMFNRLRGKEPLFLVCLDDNGNNNFICYIDKKTTAKYDRIRNIVRLIIKGIELSA